jgi:hypothetical protein
VHLVGYFYLEHECCSHHLCSNPNNTPPPPPPPKTQCSKCSFCSYVFLCEAWWWLIAIVETCCPYSVFVTINWRVVLDGIQLPKKLCLKLAVCLREIYDLCRLTKWTGDEKCKLFSTPDPLCRYILYSVGFCLTLKLMLHLIQCNAVEPIIRANDRLLLAG